MPKQKTLKNSVEISGKGLHSGVEVQMALKPAEVDSGIFFVRTDLAEKNKICATPPNVTSTLRATTLEENGVKVFTVEHLMSALSACGIDNCAVEMNAEEPPVLEGNSIGFFEMI